VVVGESGGKKSWGESERGKMKKVMQWASFVSFSLFFLFFSYFQ
jgi:hypothetical protein